MAPGRQTAAIGLEGMLATLTVLKVCSDDLTSVERELRAKVQQLPNFFHDGPIVIDLAAVDGSLDDPEAPPLSPLSLEGLLGVLHRLELVPVGIRNPRAQRLAEARALGLSSLQAMGRKRSEAKAEAIGAAQQPAREAAVTRPEEHAPRECGETVEGGPRNLTLRTPVRGGQVVHAQGDVIALGAVNSGAEVIAEGNVHVYGPLRGRAAAGVHGDAGALIFCQSLEAELVSIAGVYLGADELPEAHRGKPVRIALRDDALVIESL